MCHRIEPLTVEELREALANLARHGRATLRREAPQMADAPRRPADTTRNGGVLEPRPQQAYPGSTVPVVVEDPGLRAAVMSWGFWNPHPASTGRTCQAAGRSTPAGPAPEGSAAQGAGRAGKVVAKSKLVFNTRLDTGVRQLREGRGMWAQAMASGRCLVPVRAFYEDGPATGSPRPAPIRRPFRFTLAGSSVFLLAGIAEDGRFSIVTTAPNSRVAPVHNRMPLVLAPGESRLWLAGDLRDPAVLGRLADRSRVVLDVAEEEPLAHPDGRPRSE